MSVAIDFAAATDVGLKRRNNEDSHAVLAGVDQQSYVVILADGMGGHQKGELASSLAVRYVRERLSQEIRPEMDSAQIRRILESVVEKANVKVYLESLADRSRWEMGTTLTTAVIRGSKLIIGHIGDCRCYVLRAGQFLQLTVDHTLVQVLVDRGEMKAEEARRHPRKNEVMRALGSPEFVKADMIEARLEPGDRLLFCSDGLHDYVEEGAIQQCLAQAETPKAACWNLISLANSTAGQDNVTCVVGFVHQVS